MALTYVRSDIHSECRTICLPMPHREQCTCRVMRQQKGLSWKLKCLEVQITRHPQGRRSDGRPATETCPSSPNALSPPWDRSDLTDQESSLRLLNPCVISNPFCPFPAGRPHSFRFTTLVTTGIPPTRPPTMDTRPALYDAHDRVNSRAMHLFVIVPRQSHAHPKGLPASGTTRIRPPEATKPDLPVIAVLSAVVSVALRH